GKGAHGPPGRTRRDGRCRRLSGLAGSPHGYRPGASRRWRFYSNLERSKEASMTTKFRAAIIGCGGMARNHIRGYIDSGRYEIVSLADLHEAPMAEVNQQFNISPRHYNDARQML